MSGFLNLLFFQLPLALASGQLAEINNGQRTTSSSLMKLLTVGCDRVELGLGFLSDLVGERRVWILRVFGYALAVVYVPPEEVNERPAFGGVLLLLIDEDVGVTGNRISLRAGRIRDRDAQVVGRLRDRLGGSGRRRIKRWRDEVARPVFDERDRQYFGPARTPPPTK